VGVGILALIEHSHKEPEEGQKNLNLRSKNSDIDKYYLRCVGRPELLTRDDELYHGRRIMAEKEIHSTIKDVLLYLEDLVQEGHIDSSFLVGYRNGDTHSFFTQKARDIISLEQKLENCKVYRGKQAENIKANIISNLDEAL